MSDPSPREGRTSAREAILAAGRRAVQSRGYGGLNLRDLGAAVGIKAASIYHHFPGKAELAAAVARRYWEDAAAELDAVWAASRDAGLCLEAYPTIFRRSLESDNRLCLSSFLSAEYDDLPELVRVEVRRFAEVNIAWLAKVLGRGESAAADAAMGRARAIFAAVTGAQLLARGRADVALFDAAIRSYRELGLLKP